mgnify:CR=1 FL=1
MESGARVEEGAYSIFTTSLNNTSATPTIIFPPAHPAAPHPAGTPHFAFPHNSTFRNGPIHRHRHASHRHPPIISQHLRGARIQFMQTDGQCDTMGKKTQNCPHHSDDTHSTSDGRGQTSIDAIGRNCFPKSERSCVSSRGLTIQLWPLGNR